MDFASHLDDLMQPFIKAFGQCAKTPISKATNKKLDTHLISLYQDLLESNATVFADGCFQHRIVNVHSAPRDVIRPDDFSKSRFFPGPIQQYIKEHELYQLIFSCKNVGGREINVHFTLFAEKDLDQLALYEQNVRLMYIWLNICAKYAKKTCTNILDIYIYPTPFTKNLPGSTVTVLGPEHVNTAFTFACAPHGQLIIFREEEWFKVFIHETFHAYGLDFALSEEPEFKNTIKSLFPIESDFDLHEAYTETWARIINCALCSFNALAITKEKEKEKRDKQQFLQNFNFCMGVERLFALYQCTKVLNFMGLHYKDIQGGTVTGTGGGGKYLTTKLYKENTHVFAYYIMTAIFLNDYQGFLLWCHQHNTNLLQFDFSPANFKAFAVYITSVYNCPTLLEGIDYMGKMHQTQGNKGAGNKGAGKNEILKKTTRRKAARRY